MPFNVFGNSSHDNNNKIDTSLFVQKPFLRSNYIEAKIEEDIDLRNQYRVKNLPDSFSIQDACTKIYVDNIFRNDIDNAIDETALVRNNQDNDFNNKNLTNVKSITLNFQAVNDNEVITKSYVDLSHQEFERSRRDAGLDFYNESSDLVKNKQDNDLNDKKLTNLGSITNDRNPTSDSEVSNKNYIDDELDKNTIVRLNKTLQNYLKVSVGKDTYNLSK